MPLGEGVPGVPGVPGGAGGHGSESCSLSRLRSSSLEKGSEILREQLTAAQRELQLKGEECERLSRVRDQLEQELEELTASLFEEANKMVHEASRKQAAAEKQLREAQGKIDVLQAEVSALKTLVLTSTPASPNPQLHPQLLPPARGGAPRRGGGHVRNKSAGSPALPPAPLQPMGKEGRELDSVLYAEFLSWKEQPSLERTSAFMNRVYREDIGPCLSFTRRELAEAVQAAVESNSLSVEPVALQTLPVVKASAVDRGGPNGCRGEVETRCALSGLCCPCTHRIRLGDSEVYYPISPSSRARITAVCNFFTYVRYIQQGLVRQDAAQVFWELMRLRREMSMAKLGVYWTEEG